MTSPSEILLEWERQNHLTAPKYWLEICLRLAHSPDMEFAWPSLLAAGATPMKIFGMTTVCYDESGQDVRRLPSKEELRSIEKVRKSASNLVADLRGAQLLSENAPIGSIDEMPVAIAWTDSRAKILENSSQNVFPVLSLPDLLKILQSKCDELLTYQPVNAIERQTQSRNWSQARAFVRRLAAQFRHENFKGEMPENLARIAYAVFQLETPMTGRDVEKCLRDSPFRN